MLTGEQPQSNEQLESVIGSPDVPELQQATDQLFVARAQNMLGPIGRRVLHACDISARNEGDGHLTHLETYFVTADEAHTEQALNKFKDVAANAEEQAERFWGYLDWHRLTEHKKILFVVPHLSLTDVKYLTNMSLLGAGAEKRSAADNHTYLGRFIGYVDYHVPRTNISGNVVQDFLLPTSNIAQVFPLTKTTEPLRQAYGDEIRRHNTRAALAMQKMIKQRQANGQQMIFLAPTGTRAKSQHKGLIRVLPGIAPQTRDMIVREYASGTPIVAATARLPIRAYLPKVAAKNMTLELDPHGPIVMRSDEAVDNTAVMAQVEAALLRVANVESIRPVHAASAELRWHDIVRGLGRTVTRYIAP